jgi:hypothetical protein
MEHFRRNLCEIEEKNGICPKVKKIKEVGKNVKGLLMENWKLRDDFFINTPPPSTVGPKTIQIAVLSATGWRPSATAPFFFCCQISVGTVINANFSVFFHRLCLWTTKWIIDAPNFWNGFVLSVKECREVCEG